jgi:polyhydroxyalkanoate synthesis regulator phasin
MKEAMNMSDMKNILRDIGYFGVGAAAVIIEAGAKAGKALIRKGEKTLRDNQDTVDDLKRKARDLGEKVKASMEKTKAENPPVNAAAMTPEERDALRRQLDEADAVCEEPVCEEPVCDEPVCDEPVCEEPVIPDLIYHTDAPAPGSEDDPNK